MLECGGKGVTWYLLMFGSVFYRISILLLWNKISSPTAAETKLAKCPDACIRGLDFTRASL